MKKDILEMLICLIALGGIFSCMGILLFDLKISDIIPLYKFLLAAFVVLVFVIFALKYINQS